MSGSWVHLSRRERVRPRLVASGVACGCARRATGWWLRAFWLSFGLLLASCGRAPEEPAVDMELIRGEPIEGSEDSAEMGLVEANLGADASNEALWLEEGDELVMVGFDRLAGFEYEVKDDAGIAGGSGAADQIPQAIQELDGREVGVRGFMLPLKLNGGLVKEFLLMRDQSMCCFGVIPKINEWVAVTMTGRGVRALMDQPVTVFGTLRVGEIYEHGVLGGIYRMDGEELAGALDL
jgi:hypothetical protein